MNKDVISTPNAPAAVGPYSQGIRVGDIFFLSGQIPLDPATSWWKATSAPRPSSAARTWWPCWNPRA